MSKKILGLDLGTNSIGWALVNHDFENKQGEILGMGSRIIPMSQDILGEFDKGNSISQTAERTSYRSIRRLRERHLLRRERLHRVLNVLGFLPKHYAFEIDFEKRLGKFFDEKEPKIAWKKNDKEEFEFLFQKSFNEMVADFKVTGQEIKVPYDWTIYYLRKKALKEKIEKEELAWLILNFNQKRGYYQLRGEEDEDATRTAQTRIYFDNQTISSIIDTGAVYKGLKVIQITLSNGDTGKYFAKEVPNWVGVKKNIIATIDLDKEGNDKYEDDGSLKRRFSIPTEEDWDKKWKLVKIKTEREIKDSEKTVGTYIYDTLLQNPKQKIKGKLVRTIERKFYKQELKQILEKQIELQPELFTSNLLNDCIRELYKNNEVQQQMLQSKDFVHLFLNDIIFYQRPLRSQKSSIGNCTLEYHKYKDKEGVEHTQYLKAIPKSNPYYQEFRIWQWMYNLSIYKKDDDRNAVTSEFLNSIQDWEKLFDFLNSRKEIEQKPLLKYLLEQKDFKGKLLTAEIEKYRWNYVEDKKYPCNETKTMIATRLEKVENIPDNFLTRETEQKLWHIIYSVTDKIDYEKALKSFAIKHQLDESSFVEAFRKLIIKENTYGSFSEKAIKKLLPLMRLGKFWDEDDIVKHSDIYFKNIEILLDTLGQKDKNISDEDRQKWNKTINIKLRDELENFQNAEIASFQGLRLHIAQYIAYGRHSEAGDVQKWNSIDDLEKYLEEFKQHSLRNPIVEQVVTETFRVVKDIWKQYGNGVKDFFNEIHIELGREMKNSAEDRKKITNMATENENTNLRIKALLAEMMSDEEVENVRPYSPMQQEILKIYEEGVLNSDIEIEEEYLKISKTAQPSSSDLKKYKLWLEQKYKSPYTGQIIPLNKLFTPEYEIEHIIPQSRYFDDSFSNKVICEAAVNKLKDNNLGLEFIKKFHGQIVETGFGKSVKVFEVNDYEDFVKQHYAKSRGKRNKLLLEEIPEKMIERQMNDTRYISKFILGLLSNIVRSETNDDGVNSKNVIPCNGKITTDLKQGWGLNDIWNDLILPRFERMNGLTNTSNYTTWNENHQKFLPTVPIELSKNFQKKRIDHRHHAMDALVIACATRDHVNYMNNEHALRKGKSKEEKQNIRYNLRSSLCDKEYNDNSEKNYKWTFKKPWKTFTQEARNALENIVISFKQNLRVINKATNHYEKYVERNGQKVKEQVEQKGTNWAIRKPMHKDTVSGKVELQWYKMPKGKIVTATRKSLDTSFDLKTIGSITDTGIQKILKNYLQAKDGNPELAFSFEGIEDLNRNIERYNDGKSHQPIYKVRIFELGSKFQVGQSGNKKYKYVEAAKGTNLFFAVYEGENGMRSYESIPLNEVIERQKQGLPPVSFEGKKGFYLCPNDLVYLPIGDELQNPDGIDFQNLSQEKKKNIYKVVSFTGNRLSVIPATVATTIVNKVEYTQLNKIELTKEKEHIVKLKIDRLGNISKA